MGYTVWPMLYGSYFQEKLNNGIDLNLRSVTSVDVNFTRTCKRFHSISNMDRVVHSTLVHLLLYFAFTITHGILAGGNNSNP